MVVRSTLIAMIVVAVLSVCVCAGCLLSVTRTIDSMQTLRVRAAEFVRAGDDRQALEELVRLANRWKDAAPILEILTSHDDLHDATREILDAQVCLEAGDFDECNRVLSQLGETLMHIGDMEQIRLSNLY